MLNIIHTEKKPLLALVLPCYNEELVIDSSVKILLDNLEDLIKKQKISNKSLMLLVDDGSQDKTWEIIKSLNQKNPQIKGLKLSKNFGHQSAILAGMLSVKDHVDCLITMDIDLQDNTEVIEKFVDAYRQGYEIAYGVRKERASDTFFKRTTAHFFYKIQNLLGVESIMHHADYRLVGKKALEALADFKEVNLFLRGLFPLMGFKSIQISYERQPRLVGETKYTLYKMFSLALDGITSFSIKPIRLITLFGVIIFIGSLLMMIWVLVQKIMGQTIVGWASTVIPIYVLSGIQIIFLGILGEYIGKIYKEVKERPRFIIEEQLL